MPAIDIPEARDKIDPDQCTIRNLLIENGQMIETAAEYQRMGKIEEAIKYQKLIHQNLMRAATMADPQFSAQMMQEIGSKPCEEDNNQPTAAGQSVASPQTVQQQQPIQINATQQFSPAQTATKSISPQQAQQRAANMNAPTTAYPPPQQAMQPQQQVPQIQQQPPHLMYGQQGPGGGNYNGFMAQQPQQVPPNAHAPQMAPIHYSQQTPYPAYGANMYQQHQMPPQQQQDKNG